MTTTNVYVYLFDDYENLDKNFINDNINKLPEFRREKCVRYRLDIDKKNCIITYLLLKHGLNEIYGISSDLEFVLNENGKPFLKDHPFVYFNFSHCKYGAVCVIAEAEVGVDIEGIERYKENIAQRVCSDNELKQLEIANDPVKLFFRIWTEKESYAKAKGLGISSVLKKDLQKDGFWYYENELYYLTVFCENAEIELFHNTLLFTPDEDSYL